MANQLKKKKFTILSQQETQIITAIIKKMKTAKTDKDMRMQWREEHLHTAAVGNLSC